MVGHAVRGDTRTLPRPPPKIRHWRILIGHVPKTRHHPAPHPRAHLRAPPRGDTVRVTTPRRTSDTRRCIDASHHPRPPVLPPCSAPSGVRYVGRRTLRSTIRSMRTLTIRTDANVERALESLTSEGQSRSEAVRNAILETERAHRRARLRAEAESLRDDPDDVAASRELATEMDAIRAW